MYSLKYKVTTSTCDSEGRLKLYSALQMMQDCSEMWIDSEPEVRDYFLQQNMAQLLATRQVEIIRVPNYKEELTVTTSVYGMKPMFGFRNTFIYDAQGNPCYKTWSMGAFVDRMAGKLKRVDDATIASMTLEPQLEMNYRDRRIILPKIEGEVQKPIQVLRICLDSLQWTREPAGFEVKGDTIRITTAPKTDLWQRTYYHFQNDNAPVLQMKTREKFFSFVVKTDFTGSHHRFDQCGIVMYLGSENWLKGSVEYENDEFQHLGSVVTNNGYSDWATTAIPADVKTMWYRFSRREDDYCIECSADGQTFSQMRICHMPAAAEEISFGIYACSPEESSFTAIFSDMKITECAWKAHDGQQPD